MSLLSRIGSVFRQKESETRIVSSMHQVGQAQATPANYEAFARLGYSKNVATYIAISKVAMACSGIEWCLYSKSKGKRGEKTEVTDSPLLTLLDKPNPDMALSTFIETVVAYYKITGNSYIEANMGLSGKIPLELWPARPDKMKIIPGKNGFVAQYQYSNGGVSRSFDVDPVKMQSKIMHWKTFNPINMWYGLSPLEAALLSLDQNNAGQRWNLALLQNNATPSGVLQMKVTDINPRGALTNEQYGRLKAEFENHHQGAGNAGRPMILEGGLNWQSIALGPKDMDFIQNKNITATDILAVYGVPGELVGLGQKTFNNYKEARLSFYEDTVLPTMDSLRDKFNQWLTPAFGDNLYLDYDKDDIEALVEKREAKYTSLSSATFLSENEKRQAAGYEEVEGLDLFKLGNEHYSMEELKDWDKEEEEPVETVTDETNNPPQNPPPKKPQTDQTDNDITDEDTDQQTEETEEESEKGFKSINLLNANEKRKSWKTQNAKRKRLEKYFSQDIEEDFRDLLTQLKKITNGLKNSEERIVEFALIKEISEWTPQLKKTLSKHTRLALIEFGSIVLTDAKSQKLVPETKKNLDWESFVTAYIEKRTGSQISTITNTTEKQVKRIVRDWVQEAITAGDSVQELSFYLETEFEGLSKSNAQRIARTEVALASNNGSLEAVKSLQIPGMYKEWVSANDSRVRDGGDNGLGADHAAVSDDNGEIPIDDMFKVNPDVMMSGPGDTGAPADQVINCRCVLVFKNKGEN